MRGEPSCKVDGFGEVESEAGIWWRQFEATEPGQYIHEHRHHFGHDVLCYRGEADVFLLDPGHPPSLAAHLTPGDRFFVPAESWHRIEPTVLPYGQYCVFPSREGGMIADHATGWREASEAIAMPSPEGLA